MLKSFSEKTFSHITYLSRDVSGQRRSLCFSLNGTSLGLMNNKNIIRFQTPVIEMLVLFITSFLSFMRVICNVLQKLLINKLIKTEKMASVTHLWCWTSFPSSSCFLSSSFPEDERTGQHCCRHCGCRRQRGCPGNSGRGGECGVGEWVRQQGVLLYI